jgi:thiol-disulfide isomerase/thioredoxin
MDRFNENVTYLQDSDFDSTGKLLPSANGKPVVVMIMDSWCGFCKKMKPTFQEFADKVNGNKAYCAVIKQDGNTDSEKQLAKRIKSIVPTFSGFPTIVKFKDGKYVGTHNGARTLEALESFI